MTQPIAIDLYCGRGGWTDGLLAAGFTVIGFDIQRFRDYRGQLVLQDVRTVDGARLHGASVIVASPPCTEFSRFDKKCWFDVDTLPAPDMSHVEACRRIARESGVPTIMENVRGAEQFIGTAAAHLGSFYLWGDVPPLLPHQLIKGCKHTASRRRKCKCGEYVRDPSKRARIPFGLAKYIGDCYATV